MSFYHIWDWYWRTTLGLRNNVNIVVWSVVIATIIAIASATYAYKTAVRHEEISPGTFAALVGIFTIFGLLMWLLVWPWVLSVILVVAPGFGLSLGVDWLVRRFIETEDEE